MGTNCGKGRSAMAEERKESWRERTARMLDIPPEGLTGVPQLSLTGERELFLEGYQGVLSYGKEEITVGSPQFLLRITGRELEIKAMGPGQLRIVGWVTGLELV
jgi:sporulation protein YqfC